MKQNNASNLLKRYLAAQETGKEVYFDADEIDEILESLETSDDFTHYEAILSLGLRLHPDNPELRVRQCKSLIYNEEYDKALTLIESLADADQFELDLMRLECYCALDQYHKVVSYIESRIDKREDLEEIFEYLTPILSDMDMEEETSDFIQRGLLLFPDNITLKDELCLHLESIGDFKGAIKICNELIDKNPYSVDYWFMLGRLYSMSGEYEKAIEAFDFALTCDDSDVELKILKAYCLYMNENYEKAIEVYSDIISTEWDMKNRLNPLLAECYIKLGKFEDAYQILKKQLSEKVLSSEDDVSVFLNYIRCCMETEREEDATEALDKAIELYPDNIRLLSILAIKYTEEGKSEEAKKVTEKLFQLIDEAEDSTVENAESLFQTAQYLNLKNEVKEALQYYLKILNIDPQMPFINMYVAMAYLAMGDIDSFNKYYQQTPPEELTNFLNNSGINVDDLLRNLETKHIEPENLTKEFLKNKEHRN
ncbi:tetratricopeptide repeat protein [Massilibacteroides sp.]|uniref:tetratricopeptide repeat protein n=1 Tax=Massilibacteroides sp. TaxID=2034766 RepID=UPI00261C72FE|nr:tetratricopeptide repeat protein [Massilibacteroides sp.]MDD4514263.1 CDC27 family protein [Massilibacteroides sp.]